MGNVTWPKTRALPIPTLKLSGIDKNLRTATFIASCDSVDSFGTILTPTGLRLDRLKKNPVFLWQHKREDPDDVIGTLVDIRLEGSCLKVTAQFSDNTDLARRCWQAVLDGRVNAVSIGFDTIAYHQEGDAIVIDEAEVYEVSLCIIGSNPDALAVRAFIEGGKMNPETLKKLGLAEGASPEDIVTALIQYLAKSDEDKALATEVIKGLSDMAKPAGDAPPAGAPSAESTPPAAADETRAEGEPAKEDKPAPDAPPVADARMDEIADGMRKIMARMDDMEKRILKPSDVVAAIKAERSPATPAKPAVKPAQFGQSVRLFRGGNPAPAPVHVGQSEFSSVRKLFDTVNRNIGISTGV